MASVRGVGDDLLALLVGLLTGVAGERHGPFTVRVAVIEELLELPVLAVGQGVHRVDDDGLYAASRSTSQDVVHHGDYVGKALARASAGRKAIVVPRTGRLDRLGLVTVQSQVFSRVVKPLLPAKYTSALLVQNTLRDQLVDRLARLEGGV
jgi:hypothetical protein